MSASAVSCWQETELNSFTSLERGECVRIPFPSSLDIRNTKLTAPKYQKTLKNITTPKIPFPLEHYNKEFEWTSKQKRAYQRVLSGFKKASYLDYQMRFMTLTSSSASDIDKLNRHFQVLRYRIQRKFGRMQYFKVKTNEGNGVLHIVFYGPYIPQAWLSQNWKDIHGASIVDIRAVKGTIKRLARYVVSQYVCGQSFIRNSWSLGWVFPGFVKTWNVIKSTHKGQNLSEILKRWDDCIKQHCLQQNKMGEYG